MLNTLRITRPAPAVLVAVAFAIIYIIWGTTYLGIKLALVGLPPFVLSALRFVLAGVVLLAVGHWRGHSWPTKAQWRSSFWLGLLMITIANGGVVWAEVSIDSGVASLIVASEPLWLAILLWRRSPPTGQTKLSLVLGAIGMLILSRPHEMNVQTSSFWGLVVCLVASIAWAFGSTVSGRMDRPQSTFISAGAMMLMGGMVSAMLAAAMGNWHTTQWVAIPADSWWATLYLALLGSVVAFTAFDWLLRRVPPGKVLTHAYVNPIIALLLGWGWAGEVLDATTLLAAALLLLAVFLVISDPRAQHQG